jgi:hypothetical protein
MLAGDLFDTPKVLWQLQLFKRVYVICGLRDWRRWRAEHTYGWRRRARRSPAARPAGQRCEQMP